MNADIAPDLAMDDVAERRKAAMERDLERDWDSVRACLGELEPGIVEVARNSFWLGVKTGVCVTTKAVNGAYR
jgi:hypothetical protein